jgi:hypothetical protein
MHMKVTVKRLVMTGAAVASALVLYVLLATGPGAVASGTRQTTTTTAPASTTTTAPSSPPKIITSNFVCSSGVCAIGPGDVGMPFAAGLIGTGGPPYGGPECNPYLMSVVTGSLPPGMQLGEPICEWEITGTPTSAGTYTFTVQIAPQPDGFGNPRGPDGFQQFNVTIGTGGADRLLVEAVWVRKFLSLRVSGFDVNNGATYTVYVTSTGAKLGSFTEKTPDNGGDGSLRAAFYQNAPVPSELTVTDSLGTRVTIPVGIDNNY